MAPKPRPWFRMYTETAKDRKVRRLDPATRWLMVTCFSVARESPRPGWLLLTEGEPYEDEDLRDAAALTLRQVKSGVAKLKDAQILEQIDGVLHVTNWDKRQYEGDSSTERSRRSRAKSSEGCNDDATLHERSMQRPRSVQRTEDREQRTELGTTSNNTTSVATRSPVVGEQQQVRDVAVAMGHLVAAQAPRDDPAAYAAGVTKRILKGDDPEDRNRIRAALSDGCDLDALARSLVATPAPPAHPVTAWTPCKAPGCVNGMTYDDTTGMASRCRACNDVLPIMEVVR